MKNKKKKIILFIFIVIVIVTIITIIIVNMFKKEKVDTPTNVEVVLNEISDYGITLSDKDSELYKKEYEILKTNLESGSINYDEYAKSIAKLFIIDLYTISTKINKYDVGGSELVYPDKRDNYRLNVEDTIYKYVEDDSMNQRRQELPTVASIDVKTIKKDKFKYNNNSYDAYKVSLTWTYNKNLGYDDEGDLIIIKADDKLYIAEKN